MDAIDLHTLLYGTPQNMMILRQDGMMNLTLSKIASSAQLTFAFSSSHFVGTRVASLHPVHLASLCLSIPLSFFFLFAPLIAFSVSAAIKMIGDCVMYINVLVLLE